MIDVNIINENAISMHEVRKLLKKIQKKEEELNYRANKTVEYLNHFDKLKDKEYDELHKKLEGLKVGRIREQQIIKIMDVLPLTPEEVRSVLQHFNISLNLADLKKIADTVSKYANN